MDLSRYVVPEHVVLPSADAGQWTKAEALDALAGVVSEAAGIDGQSLREAVEHRESLMSTGVGQGLAVPHVRLPGLSKPYMAVGVCPAGVEGYASLDGLPVQVVVLIAAPQGQHETYIKMLAAVVEVLKDAPAREALIATADPNEICRILAGKS